MNKMSLTKILIYSRRFLEALFTEIAEEKNR